MNKILNRDNSIYRFTSCQPYMNNINQYIIHYDKYTFYHYARRTSGDKYSRTYSKHLFLVDVSNVETSSRYNFILGSWDSFVWQIIDYNAYNKGTIVDNDPSSSPLALHPHEDGGRYRLNTLYTTQSQIEYRYSTLFHMYGATLIELDIMPSDLKLQVWSGYDSRNNNEIQYYNNQNFVNDLMTSTIF